MDDLAFLDLWLHHSSFRQLLHITLCVCGGGCISVKSLCLSLYKNTLHLEHTQISQDSEKVELLVTQLCPTLCNPIDCSPPGSSVHMIFLGRILEWVAISFSRGSSQSRNQTRASCISCIADGFFTTEPPGKPSLRRQCHLAGTVTES